MDRRQNLLCAFLKRFSIRRIQTNMRHQQAVDLLCRWMKRFSLRQIQTNMRHREDSVAFDYEEMEVESEEVDCRVLGCCRVSPARTPKRPALRNATNTLTENQVKKRLIYGQPMSSGAHPTKQVQQPRTRSSLFDKSRIVQYEGKTGYIRFHFTSGRLFVVDCSTSSEIFEYTLSKNSTISQSGRMHTATTC